MKFGGSGGIFWMFLIDILYWGEEDWGLGDLVKGGKSG